MSDSQDGDLRRVFVLGGVRSGKSRYSSEVAKSIAGDQPVLFIATAELSEDDTSMRHRIERHMAERPSNWRTIEEPVDLGQAILSEGTERGAVVDCLTVWLSNLLVRCGDPDQQGFYDAVEQKVYSGLDALCDAIEQSNRHLVLVANDVGSGVAPPTRLGNVFADMQGTVNQRVAAECGEVYQMVAGIENRIK